MQIVDGKPYIQQIKALIIEYTKRLVCDLILVTNKTIDKKITPLPRESFSWLWKAKMSLE
jgi:hypothetical protein